jgi:hypothetical protein
MEKAVPDWHNPDIMNGLSPHHAARTGAERLLVLRAFHPTGRRDDHFDDGRGTRGHSIMAISTILLIIVILLLLGAVPAWPYSRSWGYGPSGVLGVVLLILIILLLMGRL